MGVANDFPHHGGMCSKVIYYTFADWYLALALLIIMMLCKKKSIFHSEKRNKRNPICAICNVETSLWCSILNSEAIF
jgi:hypothetical protein